MDISQKRRRKKDNTLVNEKSTVDAGASTNHGVNSDDQLNHTISDLNRNWQKSLTSQPGGIKQENDDQVKQKPKMTIKLKNLIKKVLMLEKTKFWKVICPVGEERLTFNLLRDRIVDSFYSDIPLQIKSIISPSEQVRGHVIVESSKREHVEEAVKEFNNLILEDNQQGIVSMNNELSVKQLANQTKLNQKVRSKRKALSNFNQETKFKRKQPVKEKFINQKEARQNAPSKQSKKKELTHNQLINLEFNKSTKELFSNLNKISKQTQTDIDLKALERIYEEIYFLRQMFLKNQKPTNQDFVTESSTTQPLINLTLNKSANEMLKDLNKNLKSTQTEIDLKEMDKINQELCFLKETFVKNSINQNIVNDFLSLPNEKVLIDRLKQLKSILISEDPRQSFVYLIIDPELYEVYKGNRCLTTFLAMIIYIGSGSVGRLVFHFLLLKKCFEKEMSVNDTEMPHLYQPLLDIWNLGKNIIVMHNIANEPLFKSMSDCIERLSIEAVKLINPDRCVNIGINEYHHQDLPWTNFRWYRAMLALHILQKTIDNKKTKFIEVSPGQVIEQTAEIELYECNWPGCDFKNIKQCRMTDHMRIHTGDMTFACDFQGCDYIAGSSSDLTAHKQRHNSEKPFKCDFDKCQKAFTIIFDLEKHMRKHTGEKPYKCDFQGCQKAFSNASHLTRHKQKHTGVKPYECDLTGCKQAFFTASDLTVHMRRHASEKKCDFQGCGRTFSRTTELTRHKKRHNGDKPYTCNFKRCKQAFSFFSLLEIHKKVHSGEKLLTCD